MFSDSDGNECEEYLIKWKGYDSDESTWEAKSDLTDPMVQVKIRKFQKWNQ